jgi:hypothetical protein
VVSTRIDAALVLHEESRGRRGAGTRALVGMYPSAGTDRTRRTSGTEIVILLPLILWDRPLTCGAVDPRSSGGPTTPASQAMAVEHRGRSHRP